jgi:DNA-binding CsgD family transcriptional regulator
MAQLSIADLRQTRPGSRDLAELRDLMRSMNERLGAALDELRATPPGRADDGRARRAALAVRDVVSEIVSAWTGAGLAADEDRLRSARHANGVNAATDSSHPDLVAPAVVDPADGDRRLTAREYEVAELVAAGLGNADIADRLFISKRTVESHVENVKVKLGFRTRHQVIAWFFQGASLEPVDRDR